MTVLTVLRFPDERLRTKAEEVTEVNDDIRKIVDDMFETMYAADGIGLAAPQVGIPQRVIIVDIEAHSREYPLIALINPVITEATGEELGEAGAGDRAADSGAPPRGGGTKGARGWKTRTC